MRARARKTSKGVARAAARLLRDPLVASRIKTVAGSALSQRAARSNVRSRATTRFKAGKDLRKK